MPKQDILNGFVNEEIEEVHTKLKLLESDKKTYYENCRQALEDCKKHVGELRRENNKYRVQLRERLSADDFVINQAFQNKPVERAMLTNKSTTIAIDILDCKVCGNIKKLNYFKHISLTKQKILDDIQFKYNELFTDNAKVLATFEGMNKEGQIIRDLENRFDKAKLKCGESDHIKKTYEQIKAELEEEHLHYGNNLDAMEIEIKGCCYEIKDLKVLHQDAILARDSALEELKRQEDIMFNERRRRDLELANMRQVAQEKQLILEKIEKRAINWDSTSNIDESILVTTDKYDDQQKYNVDYDGLFNIIKEAIGVKDVEEGLLRFEGQVDTKAHLEDLKKEAEKTITKLSEIKFQLQKQYAEIKYTGETEISEGNRLVVEFKEKVEKKKFRRIKIADDLKRFNKVLVLCKSGIEHIYEKVKHIIPLRRTASQNQVEISSGEFILEMLNRTEEKLIQLLEQFKKYDIEDELFHMYKEDGMIFLHLSQFQNHLEFKLPAHNTRIKLHQAHKDIVYQDEENGDDDDVVILTRSELKKQSSHIVDLRTRIKNPKKKRAKAK